MTQGLKRSSTGAVIGTDLSAYEQIKMNRARKVAETSMREDIDQLKETVRLLEKHIKEMKRG
jgi:polyhydroxyalkanoate synthesis regulator protein